MQTITNHISINPSIMGLSSAEVQERISKGLVNTSPDKITKSTWQIIQDNVFTLFNAFNLAIGVCIALVGAYSSLFFLAIIALNVLIGIVQEWRAKKMVENLTLISSPKTCVIRDGVSDLIANSDVVLDDVVLLDAGKQIIADAMILEGEIEVNESMLTGEADPVIKRVGDTLLSGSFVICGQCYATVTHVGLQNFATQITQQAKKHKPLNSELMKAFQKVTRITSFFIIPLGVILFCEAYFLRTDSIQSSVVTSAAALLGMLPKGLVLLTSITLAVSVVRLGKKRTLVQELYSVETFAHIDTLCIDKTGTLTEGKMEVTDILLLASDILPVSLDEMMGNFIHASQDNNATFLALHEYFTPCHTLTPVGRVPFSSARKWSALCFQQNGTLILGAPDVICPSYKLDEQAKQAQKQGARILMVAYTNQMIENYELCPATPAALLILADPIRNNVRDVLHFFTHEGLHIKVISGDNPQTVAAVAAQAGIANADTFIDASTLHSDDDLVEALDHYAIFGRVTPNQKARMVQHLQQKGHKVAMTGDGVNDVLALKEADCSIAMGEGSDAARQVSQLVLLDSQFESLKDVLMEGRRVVHNMTRSASIFYLKTLYSIMLSIVAAIANIPFPFMPIQITLMDLAIEGYPNFFMTFEPNHKPIQGQFLPTVMRRALPSALLIVIYMMISSGLSGWLGLDPMTQTTLMYDVLASCSIMLVFRTCQPFNAWRAALWLSMTIGFYAATLLFRNILHLGLLNGQALLVFVVFALLAYPLTSLLAFILKKAEPSLFKIRMKLTQKNVG